MNQATNEVADSASRSVSGMSESPSTPSAATPWERNRVVFVLIFLVAALPIVSAPVLPMIDYYSHVGRYYVLSHTGSDGFLAQNFAPRWAILPNIGMDVLGTGLMSVLPTLFAAKLMMLGVIAIQFFGILFFNRQLTGKSSPIVALLIVPLLYSFIFTWGFANFLLGLGLVFWGAGWWLRQRERLWLAIPTASLIALAIFFTHGVAFTLYGLLLGGLELGFFFRPEQRSVVELAKRMSALAIQAVAPAILFALSPTATATDGITNADEAIRRLADAGALTQRMTQLAFYRFATIARVSDGPFPWVQIATNVLLLVIVLVMIRRGGAKLPRLAWPAFGIAGLLILFTPPALFGVGYVADRMPLFTAMLLVGSLSIAAADHRREWIWASLVGVVVVFKLALLVVGWSPYRQDFADYRAVASQIAPHSTVGFVDGANGARLDPGLRCEMYGPLLVPLYGQASPVFAADTAQPVALIGPLKAGLKSLPDDPRKPPVKRVAERLDAMIRDARLDYVLVCDPARLQSVTASLSPVAQRGRFALYRPSSAQAARPQ